MIPLDICLRLDYLRRMPNIASECHQPLVSFRIEYRYVNHWLQCSVIPADEDHARRLLESYRESVPSREYRIVKMTMSKEVVA